MQKMQTYHKINPLKTNDNAHRFVSWHFQFLHYTLSLHYLRILFSAFDIMTFLLQAIGLFF